METVGVAGMFIELTCLNVEHVEVYKVTKGLYKLVIVAKSGNIEILFSEKGLEKMKSAMEAL